MEAASFIKFLVCDESTFNAIQKDQDDKSIGEGDFCLVELDNGQIQLAIGKDLITAPLGNLDSLTLPVSGKVVQEAIDKVKILIEKNEVPNDVEKGIFYLINPAQGNEQLMFYPDGDKTKGVDLLSANNITEVLGISDTTDKQNALKSLLETDAELNAFISKGDNNYKIENNKVLSANDRLLDLENTAIKNNTNDDQQIQGKLITGNLATENAILSGELTVDKIQGNKQASDNQPGPITLNKIIVEDTLIAGAATVTSLNAGSGVIETTGKVTIGEIIQKGNAQIGISNSDTSVKAIDIIAKNGSNPGSIAFGVPATFNETVAIAQTLTAGTTTVNSLTTDGTISSNELTTSGKTTLGNEAITIEPVKSASEPGFISIEVPVSINNTLITSQKITINNELEVSRNINANGGIEISGLLKQTGDAQIGIGSDTNKTVAMTITAKTNSDDGSVVFNVPISAAGQTLMAGNTTVDTLTAGVTNVSSLNVGSGSIQTTGEATLGSLLQTGNANIGIGSDQKAAIQVIAKNESNSIDGEIKFNLPVNIAANLSANSITAFGNLKANSITLNNNDLQGLLDGKQTKGNYIVADANSTQTLAFGLNVGGTPSVGQGKGRIMFTGQSNPLIGLQAIDNSGAAKTPWYVQAIAGNDTLCIGPTSSRALTFDTDGNMTSPANLTLSAGNLTVSKGTITCPTPAAGTNSAIVATTAFVQNTASFVVGSTAPTNTNKLWIRTGAGYGNGVLYYYNGTNWIPISSVWTE